MSKQNKHLRNIYIRSNISNQCYIFCFVFPTEEILVRHDWINNTLVFRILNLKCDGERWIRNLQEKRIRTSGSVNRTPGPALQTICHEMPTNSDEATSVKPLRNHHDLLSYIIRETWDEAIPSSRNILKCLQPILHHMVMICCSSVSQNRAINLWLQRKQWKGVRKIRQRKYNNVRWRNLG